MQFKFPDPSDLGSASLVQLNDVSFQYPGRDDFGLKELNIGIDMGSRVAIVGPNGAGKTTLMNLLAGMIDALYLSLQDQDISRRAYIERHTKLMSVLIIKLTCTENSAMGPEDLVLIS